MKKTFDNYWKHRPYFCIWIVNRNRESKQHGFLNSNLSKYCTVCCTSNAEQACERQSLYVKVSGFFFSFKTRNFMKCPENQLRLAKSQHCCAPMIWPLLMWTTWNMDSYPGTELFPCIFTLLIWKHAVWTKNRKKMQRAYSGPCNLVKLALSSQSDSSWNY